MNICDENKQLADQIFMIFGYFCAKAICYPKKEEIACKLTEIYFTHKESEIDPKELYTLRDFFQKEPNMSDNNE